MNHTQIESKRNPPQAPITWPGGKRFAFTIFDDTDYATIENVPQIYGLLADLGFRTTKSVWPLRGTGIASCPGDTCEEPAYLEWLRVLQEQGFEIGYHLATFHTSPRQETVKALERFREYFGHDPDTAANHANCRDGIYWGSDRLSGARRLVYDLLTRFRHHRAYRGHVEGDPLFWGDLCREHIRYTRNFVFPETNTLACCSFMPYHDPNRSYVNGWFASSDGHNLGQFLQCISEPNQDQLEADGGACIMYAHLGHGFMEGERPNREFARLMERLSRKNGWFVPTSTMLDHLVQQNGLHEITARERRELEWRWLWGKLRLGGST